MRNVILTGNALDKLKEIPDESVDSVVTDPPYGISFMAKHWDYDVPKVELWQEVIRVMKPGAHLLSFGGTRTYHRMTCAIEDAGFEIRDCIQWIYGSGFPKSLDVSKAIDKQAGVEREIVGVKAGHEEFANRGNLSSVQSFKGTMGGKGGFSRPWMDDPAKVERYHQATAPATDSAKLWQGWGTALKPAVELICLARKPLSESTIAANVLKYGTGAMNIDECRIEYDGETPNMGGRVNAKMGGDGYGFKIEGRPEEANIQGRWPANIIHDGSEEVLRGFPETVSGTLLATHNHTAQKFGKNGIYGKMEAQDADDIFGSAGSAARFFYCAKASATERNEGLVGFEEKKRDTGRKEGNPGGDNPRNRGVLPKLNHHPTVKPVALIRYLVRLITPKGGICLDPFSGSCTTGIACKIEEMDFILIDKEAEYLEIGKARIKAWRKYVVLDAPQETHEVAPNQLKLL